MRVLFGLCLTFAFASSWSQQKYWIFFSDKGNGCIERDVAINQNYQDSVLKSGVSLLSYSKWLNGIVVETFGRPQELLTYSFVQNIQEVGKGVELTSYGSSVEESLDYVLKQMNGEAILEKGLSARGVKVGIIDAGFSNINELSTTEYLFKNDQVKSYRDFIEPAKSVLKIPSGKMLTNYNSLPILSREKIDNDSELVFGEEQLSYRDLKFGNGTHGKSVLVKMAGIGDLTGEQFGFATGADYYLARTENGDKEHRVEEYDWIRALEWMDSLGVKLINSSLGYSQFDDAKENYTTDQMNGQVGVTTKAAQIAVQEKGIFIVSSAGNSGNSSWRIVTVPADAPDVLTVGATTKSDPVKIGYSSEGPEGIDYIKPDVSVYSPNGTSFSSPNVAGYVACLMEYAPKMSNLELLDIVRKSGALYPYGNTYVGYGVPNAKVALQLIDNYGIKNKAKPNPVTVVESSSKKAKVILKNRPLSDITFFRKKTAKNVERQGVLNPYGDYEDFKVQGIRYKPRKDQYLLVIKKKNWEVQTTFQSGEEVVEVIWK